MRLDPEDGQLPQRRTKPWERTTGQESAAESISKAGGGERRWLGPLPAEALEGGSEIRRSRHELRDDQGESGSGEATEEHEDDDERGHGRPRTEEPDAGRNRGVAGPVVICRSHSRQPTYTASKAKRASCPSGILYGAT